MTKPDSRYEIIRDPPRPTTDKAAADTQRSRLVTIRASTVKPRNIDFIWPNGDKAGGRLARGKHTCFAGEGGLGKSQLLISVTATVTTGGEWPCGEGRSPLGNVIVLSAEDGVDDVLVPRLLAAGADMERVEIVQAIAMEDGKSERRFSLQTDLIELEKKIAEIRKKGNDVALVWIDPVTSYMGKVDSHNNTALRGVLDPISEMAERTTVAFASVTHFTKGSADKGIKAMHRVMGGAAFTTAPRAAFAVIQDPDDENRRLLLHLKNNLGPAPQGLAYRLGQWRVGIDERTGKDIWASHVLWDSAPVAKTADEAIAPGGKEEATAKDDAKRFLEEVLADGPMLVTQVEVEAEAAGLLKSGQRISQCKPFRAARDDLKIHTPRDGFGRGAKYYWHLPIHSMDALKPHGCPPNTEGTHDVKGHPWGAEPAPERSPPPTVKPPTAPAEAPIDLPRTAPKPVVRPPSNGTPAAPSKVVSSQRELEDAIPSFLDRRINGIKPSRQA